MPRARKYPGATNASSPANPLTTTATGRGYGKATELADQQAAVPMSPTATTATTATNPAGDQIARTMQAAQNYVPPNLGLSGPSTRPDEPVTAATAEPVNRLLTPIDRLKAVYARTRNPDLMDLIVLIESRGRG